jgi:hypothetical protein
MTDVRALVAVGDDEIVPLPELFWHRSTMHGQAHVARVLVHAFRLIAAVGCVAQTPRLWAAVYLHDIARTHDGRSRGHGAAGWARLADLPDVQARLARGGVRPDDYPAIEVAVTRHSKDEPMPDEEHWQLTALLKDADGLDRVRLRDLNPTMLRHAEARLMVPFAEALFEQTDRALAVGPDYFARLWEEARLLESSATPPLAPAPE